MYCTGRSVRGDPSPYERPETIKETAELVTDAGGTGIAVRVDHTIEAEVEALFARVDREQGRLDLLAEFTDANGERPDWGEHFEHIAMTIPMFREGLPRLIDWLERIQGRARRCIGSA